MNHTQDYARSCFPPFPPFVETTILQLTAKRLLFSFETQGTLQTKNVVEGFGINYYN